MGYRFKVNDFLMVVQDAIHGVTLKHLATKLRGGMAKLTVDTAQHEMVFLTQNVASFSGLVEALLPVGKDALWGVLYGKLVIPKEVIDAAQWARGGRIGLLPCTSSQYGQPCGWGQQDHRG